MRSSKILGIFTSNSTSPHSFTNFLYSRNNIRQGMRNVASFVVLVLSNWLLVSHATSFPNVLNDPGIKQLRKCALSGLDLSIGYACPTDDCVCQSNDLPSVLVAVSTAVDSQCSTNMYDATAAMFAVISYCSVHGYTVPQDLASITTPPGTFYICAAHFTNGNSVQSLHHHDRQQPTLEPMRDSRVHRTPKLCTSSFR
jgi:hypothetical protein